MKAADIERRREMWEAHAFEEFISDLISPDRYDKMVARCNVFKIEVNVPLLYLLT